jgi:predicted MFS family arabinose efflux permease
MLTKNDRVIILLSVILFISGILAVNIYLPSLPSLSYVFHTSVDNLKLSIFLFLTSYAVSQFFWGSLSTHLGRKKTVLIGVAIACIGILLVVLAPIILVFNIGILIEGFGIGFVSILARTLLVDSFDKMKISFAISYTATAMNIMPALAAIIGGHLQHWFGWRSIFIFLFIYMLFLLTILSKKLPETHAAIKQKFSLKEAIAQYTEVFSHREFIGYSLPFLTVTGGLLGYYAATPFIFISVLHFSAQSYGYLAIAITIAYISGNTMSRYLVKPLGIDKTILLGLMIALSAALLFSIGWLFFSMNAVTILFPMAVYAIAGGLISPCCNAGAMAAMRHRAGASGAVLSAGYYAAWAIFSIILTHLTLNSLGTFSAYLGIIVIFALSGFYKLILRSKMQTTN